MPAWLSQLLLLLRYISINPSTPLL